MIADELQLRRAGSPIAQQQIQRPVYFLGVNWCHLNTRERVIDDEGEPLFDELFVNANTGMAGVIPAWKLRELLESEKVKMSRDNKIRQEYKPSTVTLDSTSREPEFTKQEFKKSLRKVSRRVPPSKSGKEKK